MVHTKRKLAQYFRALKKYHSKALASYLNDLPRSQPGNNTTLSTGIEESTLSLQLGGSSDDDQNSGDETGTLFLADISAEDDSRLHDDLPEIIFIVEDTTIHHANHPAPQPPQGSNRRLRRKLKSTPFSQASRILPSPSSIIFTGLLIILAMTAVSRFCEELSSGTCVEASCYGYSQPGI